MLMLLILLLAIISTLLCLGGAIAATVVWLSPHVFIEINLQNSINFSLMYGVISIMSLQWLKD